MQLNQQEIFLQNLINFQRISIYNFSNYDKLSIHDLKKISKKINNNIFTYNQCCEYNGKIKNNKPFIRFNSKYVNLKRLLYHNYIDNINDNKNIHMICNNDKCINFLHFDIKIIN